MMPVRPRECGYAPRAAVLATVLTTTIAAAARVPAAPADAERVARALKIKLPEKFPNADLAAIAVDHTADATVQKVKYRFKITNNGPDKITFTYIGTAYVVNKQGLLTEIQDGPTATVTKNPGETIEVAVNCANTGDPSHYCGLGELKVTPAFGFDTNPDNDKARIFSGFVD